MFEKGDINGFLAKIVDLLSSLLINSKQKNGLKGYLKDN